MKINSDFLPDLRGCENLLKINSSRDLRHHHTSRPRTYLAGALAPLRVGVSAIDILWKARHTTLLRPLTTTHHTSRPRTYQQRSYGCVSVQVRYAYEQDYMADIFFLITLSILSTESESLRSCSRSAWGEGPLTSASKLADIVPIHNPL